ncbi:hypothetical protein EI534_15650 [Pseudomonas frederiksbergensis]|nr:hypothetical protein [Pseudomonas frederiksbergensis]
MKNICGSGVIAFQRVCCSRSLSTPLIMLLQIGVRFSALTSFLFAGQVLAQEAIDRDAFFKRCEKTAADKVSFLALDGGTMQRFSLRGRTFSGEGRENINLIIDEIEKTASRPLDLKKAAYVLGTAYRESHGTMSPATKEKVWCLTDESCKKQGRKLKDYVRIDRVTGKNYVGRGYVQLTWSENYKKFGRILKLEPETLLYTNPDFALKPEYASKILVTGMYKGLFTSYRLSDFFFEKKEDWYTARKIVNPRTPRKAVTAGYAMMFYECLGGTPKFPVSAGSELEGPWL